MDENGPGSSEQLLIVRISRCKGEMDLSIDFMSEAKSGKAEMSNCPAST